MTNDNEQAAKIGLEFMKRVDLKGEEVAAYVYFNNWLNSFLSKEVIDTQEKSDD